MSGKIEHNSVVGIIYLDYFFNVILHIILKFYTEAVINLTVFNKSRFNTKFLVYIFHYGYVVVLWEQFSVVLIY